MTPLSSAPISCDFGFFWLFVMDPPFIRGFYAHERSSPLPSKQKSSLPVFSAPGEEASPQRRGPPFVKEMGEKKDLSPKSCRRRKRIHIPNKPAPFPCIRIQVLIDVAGRVPQRKISGPLFSSSGAGRPPAIGRTLDPLFPP